tara:strand:+ start:173 stop:424 length:252 start_codon:yes stop_codon:yes gene_type:complete
LRKKNEVFLKERKDIEKNTYEYSGYVLDMDVLVKNNKGKSFNFIKDGKVFYSNQIPFLWIPDWLSPDPPIEKNGQLLLNFGVV